MPAVSHRHEIAYWSIPKNACTTIKHTLFELDTGRPYARPEGDDESIHSLYFSPPDGGTWPAYAGGYFSFVVVRDPVSRFVSAYRNRVVHHGDLDRPGTHRFLRRLGRSIEPDFREFVRWFPVYAAASRGVRHHFRPQADFVRAVIDAVDRVYWLQELDQLAADLSARTGETVRFERHQTGGGHVPVELTPELLRRIETLLADDYRMLARFGQEPPSSVPTRADRAVRKLTTTRVQDSTVVRRARERMLAVTG